MSLFFSYSKGLEARGFLSYNSKANRAAQSFVRSAKEGRGAACLSFLSIVYLRIRSHAFLIPMAAFVVRILAIDHVASLSV
jgi:hypothetical protein